MSLGYFDAKCYIHENGITGYAYGHYRILNKHSFTFSFISIHHVEKILTFFTLLTYWYLVFQRTSLLETYRLQKNYGVIKYFPLAGKYYRVGIVSD